MDLQNVEENVDGAIVFALVLYLGSDLFVVIVVVTVLELVACVAL